MTLPTGLKRILWFIGLWIASISVLAVVAFIIRSAIL